MIKECVFQGVGWDLTKGRSTGQLSGNPSSITGTERVLQYIGDNVPVNSAFHSQLLK